MVVHFYYLYLILGLLCSIAFILGVFGIQRYRKLNNLYKNSFVFFSFDFFSVIKDEPVVSPSAAQLKIRSSQSVICPCEKSKHKINTLKSFCSSIGMLFTDFNYMLILVSFGILVGASFSVSLHLNQTIAEYYSDDTGNHRGFLNLLLITSGIFGSITSGLLLDYTKSFK